MKRVLTYSFIAGKEAIVKEKGAFHLFGCDTMFDENENPWVFEVNVYPDLHIFSAAKNFSMPKITKNTIELLMYFYDRWD